MHFSTVLLMLSCSLSLGGAAVILEADGSPILWSHTTSQPTGFEKVEHTLMPNPWDFVDRMNLYHVLITSTNGHMTSMGPGENQSPLWGLPVQLGWMFNSGRLEDPTDGSQCGRLNTDTNIRDTCISTNSWYSCVNYFSSVLPYLSAVKQGIINTGGFDVKMKPASGVDGYCTTYDECNQAFEQVMTNWDRFFNNLKESSNWQIPENEKKDMILGLYWTANMGSTHASAACDYLFPLYDAEEKAFAESWRNAAEYVSAVHFQSSLNNSAEFMKPLPGRILKAGDEMADFSAEEKKLLSAFSWMKSADTLAASLVGPLTDVWRSRMCSVQARESGRDLLTSLLTNSEFSFATFTTTVYEMTNCS